MTALMGLAITGRWLASSCAAVLIGERRAAGAEGVAKPNAKLVTMAGGHVIHFANPVGFACTFGEFLDERIGDCHQ